MPPQAKFFSKGRDVARLRGQRGFYIDGLTQAKAALASLPEAFRQVVAEEFDVAGRIILGEAAARVPVRSGKLKGSLGKNTRDDGLQVSVGAGDYKAKWLEFGTDDTRAQPFLYPAYRLGARYVRRQMRTWGKKAGEKVRVGGEIHSVQRAATKAAK